LVKLCVPPFIDEDRSMNALRLGFILVFGALLCSFPLLAEDNKEPVKTGLATHRVQFTDLQVKVAERGTVEAADNQAVKCEVSTDSRTNLKIKWLVENGSVVEKGDLLVELDDAYLQQQAITQQISRDAAESDLVAVEQNSKITPQIGHSRIQAAESELQAAKDNLKKLIEGDGEVIPKTFKEMLAQEGAEVERLRDNVAAAEKSLTDGKTTEAMVKAHRRKLEIAESALESTKAQMEKFEKVTFPKLRKTAESMVQAAQQTVDNEKQRAEAEERAGKTDLKVKQTIRDLQESKYKDLLEKIKKCKIYAPRAGLVAYAAPTETCGGSDQPIKGKRESVEYGQKLLTLGEPSRFVVTLPVNKMIVNQLKVGMPATVRVETFPDKALKAHVKGTATAPPKVGAADASVFQVSVEIDDNVQKLRLKPGLAGLVTIMADAKAEHVLAVPVVAVVSPKENGKKPYCLVLTADGLEEKEVELGLNNGTMVEIKSGLKEGDVVAVDRRVLPS
jgi:HlyD family secretion protein